MTDAATDWHDNVVCLSVCPSVGDEMYMYCDKTIHHHVPRGVTFHAWPVHSV